MKKGFTLIEIIVSITLIVIIGVGSFVGVRYITNKVRINRLNQITDKVIQAAEVYLESNSEARTHLYNNGEGVVIPIKLLVNEGLLTLENTDIKESDYEKEYVVTALGSTTQSEKCVTITTNASWNLSSTTPLYICTDTNGNQNLKTVNPDTINNMSKALNESYYFRGQYVNNFVKVNGKDSRILSINTDDSIEIIKLEQDFNWALDSNQYYNNTYKTGKKTYSLGTCINGLAYHGNDEIGDIIFKTTTCENNYYNYYHYYAMVDEYYMTLFSSWVAGLTYNRARYGGEDLSRTTAFTILTLKPCMKITSGAGTELNPYIIEPNKCN